jgi:hypothetical protein
MASNTDAPVDLYIAAYADPDAAHNDWTPSNSSPPMT